MIKLPPGVPETEYHIPFFQRMLDRMGMSFYKYGPVAKGFPHKVNAVNTLKVCLDKYDRTGNKEYLIDAANYAMIEFMHPGHPDAFWEPVDSKQSAGRIWNGEIDPVQDPNTPTRID